MNTTKQFKKPDTGSKSRYLPSLPSKAAETALLLTELKTVCINYPVAVIPSPATILSVISHADLVFLFCATAQMFPCPLKMPTSRNAGERHIGAISAWVRISQAQLLFAVLTEWVSLRMLRLYLLRCTLWCILHTVGRGDDYDIVINLTVNSVEHLKYVMKKLGDVHGVIMVSRASA